MSEEKLYSGPIVDTHQHFWDIAGTSKELYGWIRALPDEGKMSGLKKNYLHDEWQKDIEGLNVVMSVHVQAEREGVDSEETAWLDEFSKKDPNDFPHALIGHADLASSDLNSTLDQHAKSSRFRGIRQLLNFDAERPSKNVASEEFMENPAWLAGLAALNERKLIFEFHVEPKQLPLCAKVASQFKDITFILDHIGCPSDRDDSGFELWRSGIEKLAQESNAVCKISGLIHPAFTEPGEWSEDSLFRWVEAVVAAFGVDRCIYGSNFPVDGVIGTYSDMLKAVKIIFNRINISQDDQKKIFHDNAIRIYNIAS